MLPIMPFKQTLLIGNIKPPISEVFSNIKPPKTNLETKYKNIAAITSFGDSILVQAIIGIAIFLKLIITDRLFNKKSKFGKLSHKLKNKKKAKLKVSGKKFRSKKLQPNQTQLIIR